MGRRGNREGTVRKRKDGRWEARISVGGKQRSLYGKTRDAVTQKMRDAQRSAEQGIPLVDQRTRVDQFLTSWLQDSVRPSVRPSTYRSYEAHVRVHLNPALGHIPLVKLQPAHVQQLMNRQLEDGLSANTVLRIRATLRRALNQAMKWGVVSRNVATLVDPPKAPRYEIEAVSPERAKAILEAVRGHQHEALVTTALATGMRLGELLGLHWADVDLSAAQLRVRWALQRVEGKRILVEPKTDRARRVIPLADVAVDSLRQQQVRQRAFKSSASEDWAEHGLVFTTASGGPLSGENVSRSFHRILKSAGLPRMRFHDLRHACASLLLVQGASPRVVMEILGHSGISMTMNTYSHVLPSLQRDAADSINALLTDVPDPN